jgi:hypothetical protein
MSEKETFEMTGEEMEYIFAQVARFGGWLMYMNLHRELCQKVFEKKIPGAQLNEDYKTNVIDKLSEEDKFESLTQICKSFFEGSKEYSFASDMKQVGAGDILQRQIYDMLKENSIWDNVKMFNDICQAAKEE